MKKLEKRKVLLLDNDGVVSNSKPIWVCSEQLTITKLAKTNVDEVFHHEVVRPQILGKSALEIATIFRKYYKYPDSPERFIELSRYYFKKMIADVELMPDIKELIEWCHHLNWTICIGSNSGKELIAPVLENHHIDTFISAIVTEEDDCKPKPHPDIWLRCLEKVGATPQDHVVVVEDAMIGVRAAKIASIKAVLVNSSDDEHRSYLKMLADLDDEEIPDVVLRSTKELTPQLLNDLVWH